MWHILPHSKFPGTLGLIIVSYVEQDRFIYNTLNKDLIFKAGCGHTRSH